MSEAPVLFEEMACSGDKFFGIATLNAEKALNSLSLEMCDLMTEKFLQWQDDDACVGVFLEGKGDKAFCAGGDIIKLYESMVECGDHTHNEYAHSFFEREYRLDYLIHTYKKPIICWANGFVMGGGIGLMSGASHRVATENSRMAMPEINIGLYPDVGGTYFLNKTPGRTGLFLGLTAYQMNAGDALFVGLADRFLKHGDKASVLEVFKSVEWNHVADSYAMVSKVLRQFEDRVRGDLPASTIQQNYELINRLMDGDSLADIGNLLAAHKTEEKWLSKGIAAFQKGCPMTAHIVYQQLQRGKHLSLAQIFQMELIVSVQCARHKDFPEGVRALLVDKDGKASWQHKSVMNVLADEIETHFTAPWGENPHPLADLG